MAMLLEVVSFACIALGGVFLVIGALGLIRFPDVFARMHGAGIVDTLGLALIMIGLMFQAGWSLVTAKLILILAFVFFTSPTATHALARAALSGGVKPTVADEGDGSSNT